MKAKTIITTLAILTFPVFLLGVAYRRSGTKEGPSSGDLYNGFGNNHGNYCKLHQSGRNYSEHPIVIYKNASIWNTHTPRDYYYFIKGLPEVECEVPCVFTWNESMVRDYADVYFWGSKPGNGCDGHSLNFYSTMESPARFKYETLDNLKNAGYDIVASMELDSDIPLTYVGKYVTDDFVKSKVLPKRGDAMVSLFISNCDAKERIEYLEELIKYGVTYHSFGKCLHNMDVANVTGTNKSSKNDVIMHYKFYFCFENSVYKDYVTEKVYQALLAGTVPIYYGAPNFADFVPRNSVIDVRSFSSPKELAEYLVMLDNNETEYNKYHAWRNDPKTSFPRKLRWILSYKPQKMLCNLCIRAADMNRLRYGLEWIPNDKRWAERPIDPNNPGKKKIFRSTFKKE